MDFLEEEIQYFLGLDIGGTWIKGCCSVAKTAKLKYLPTDFEEIAKGIVSTRSALSEKTTVNECIASIQQIIENLSLRDKKLSAIGISTAGIVDYAGKRVLKAAAHLTALKNIGWIQSLENEFKCPVVLINDADASTIGIAELGLLRGNKTVGVMPVGTGFGFSVWRNGRRWRPGKMLTLLGSIRTPAGFFDTIASASRLATADSDNNLLQIFINPKHTSIRLEYLQNLTKIINTAAILYNLDEVMICGGLADAVTACNYPLEFELNKLLAEPLVELDKTVQVTVLKEGNKLQLYGAISLARGEFSARSNQVYKNYELIKTEVPYQESLRLEQMTTSELIDLFWKTEKEAGEWMIKSLPFIASVVDEIFSRINSGGRLIYVGAGTSGRIAAMDAVEVPCTYGFPEDRIFCIISGGVADAAIEIESDFEEDASSVPEMLLLNVTPVDVVIGISASGTAYFVQSALAFAKNRGAFSVMIQRDYSDEILPFCDVTIPMNSGNEVVAGSTRMKAGTATKKILNFISSSLMIKMGKVSGSFMIDVACINNKLIERAQNILGILYNLDNNDACQKLKEADMNLRNVIIKLNEGK